MKKSLRKNLSASGMYSLIHDHSKTIVDNRRPGIRTIPLSDAVMSAMAMSSLKYSSMRQFCENMVNRQGEKNFFS